MTDGISQSKRCLLHIAVRPSPSPRHRAHPFRITTMSDKTSFGPIYVLACLPSCLPSCLPTCLPSVVRGGAVGGLETAETCRRRLHEAWQHSIVVATHDVQLQRQINLHG